MVEFNENGGLEISPGPRGFSVTGVSVSSDGTTAYFTTDEPATLNGITLPRGPRGFKGDYGDPGEARLRIDQSVGYRVFYWDTATAGENQVYGDTGTWRLADGTLVRRVDGTVETTASNPMSLPAGFRPALSGAGRVYLTGEAWPAVVTGEVVGPPQPLRGLEGYAAAVAQGFPGTAAQWIDAVYGVLPTDGTAGQYLGWGEVGPAWMALPRIGPGPWVNITLTSEWKPSTGQTAQVRMNNGTVEMVGDVTYTGPTRSAGIWGSNFVKIGTLPPAYAPDAHYDFPVRTFKGLDGTAGTPVAARVDIDTQGQLYLGAFDNGGVITLPVKANITKVNLGALPSFALRNSSGV